MLWRFIVISSLRQRFHTNSYLEKKFVIIFYVAFVFFFQMKSQSAKSDNKLQFAYRELNKWNATNTLTIVVINILRGKTQTLIYTKSKHCVTKIENGDLELPKLSFCKSARYIHARTSCRNFGWSRNYLNLLEMCHRYYKWPLSWTKCKVSYQLSEGKACWGVYYEIRKLMQIKTLIF